VPPLQVEQKWLMRQWIISQVSISGLTFQAVQNQISEAENIMVDSVMESPAKARKEQEKPRRNKGEDSITEMPGGRYRVQIDAGFDSQGQRRRKVRICSSKTEAVNVLKQLRLDKSKGNLTIEKSCKLSEFTERWLKEKKANTKQSTYESYDDTCRLHIIPAIGRFRLDKITKAHINDYLNQKSQSGLAPATVGRHKAILHGLFSLAESEGLLSKNVVQGSTKVARGVQVESIRILTKQEKDTLLKVARKAYEKEGDGHFKLAYHIVLLALATGCRRGELLGLTWANVDLRANKITIKNNIVEVKGGIRLETPKTKGSIRTISVEPYVMKELAELKGTSEWVFHNRKGEVLIPSNVGRAFRALLVDSGITGVRFHDLRHTNATEVMKATGDIKTLSKRLGNSDVATTLRIYVHSDEEEDEKAAKSMGLWLKQSANKVPKSHHKGVKTDKNQQ
jgi:integrase